MAQIHTNWEGLKKWLEGQPREVVVAIAVRSVMRALPVLGRWYEKERQQVIAVVFNFFRILSICHYVSLSGNMDKDIVRHASYADILNRKFLDPLSDLLIKSSISIYLIYCDDSEVVESALNSISESCSASGLYYASLDCVWRDINISSSATSIISAHSLINNPLWAYRMPQELHELWTSLKSRLLERKDEHWEVWTNWYDARLDPSRSIPCYSPPIPELERKRVLLPEEVWKAGPAKANAEIKRLIEEHGCRHDNDKSLKNPAPDKGTLLQILAKTASPQPVIDTQGRLDVQPNAQYDTPEVDDELLELPLRQRSLIRSLLAELEKEGNAPKSIKISLQEYDDELAARGVRPFLGLLKDHAEIIRAGVEGSEEDFGWCSEGGKAGFRRFLENHERIISHYPLDAEREHIYAKIQLKDELEPAVELKNRLADFTRAVADAYGQAQLTTKDYITALNKISELAEIISTMAAVPSQQDGESVSMVKRFILQVTGFVERTRKLLEDISGGASAIEKIVSTAHQLLDWIMMFLQ